MERKSIMTRKVGQQEPKSDQEHSEVCLPSDSRASQIDSQVSHHMIYGKKNTREANNFSNKAKQSLSVQEGNQ